MYIHIYIDLDYLIIYSPCNNHFIVVVNNPLFDMKTQVNNLTIFRSTIKQYYPSQQLSNLQELQDLANYLCDQKLFSPDQVKKLITKIKNNVDIKFPILFNQLQQIIMTTFADEQSQLMLQELKNLKLKLRETKGVLAIWKDKGITLKERYELQSIFSRGNSQMRQFYEILQQQKRALDSISEQELQMIDSLNEWIIVQKIVQPFKHYKDYQAHHHKLIQQVFTKHRVREVHFKQRKNTTKVTKIQAILGLDSKNDQPVEVTLIPKKTLDFNIMNQQLITFNAHKELLLSNHFSRFLGYNTIIDTNCFFYFRQYIEGTNLHDFIYATNYDFQEETPLFQYWVFLLYRTFYDIFIMCSYMPKLNISLRDFQISHSGLKLIFKHSKFIQSRQDNEEEFYQASLLQNLGSLILELLKIDLTAWNSQIKIKKVQNKSVLCCLLNARQGHQNYKQKRVKGCISFFNIQTHPLFENTHFLMGQTIIQNFQSIKNMK